MSQQYDANSFLMQTGVPSAKFPTVGTTVTGTIVREPELQQQTDFDTGEPLTWPDGRPRMQVRVILQTDERDPQIPGDNGERAIYIKGNLQKAVAQAVRAAGANRLEVGGKLSVTYSSDGVAQGRKNPPKLYSAKYEPPDPLAAAADPQPEHTAPASDSDTPPPGVDAAAWAKLSDAQKATLRAAIGQQQPASGSF